MKANAANQEIRGDDHEAERSEPGKFGEMKVSDILFACHSFLTKAVRVANWARPRVGG
jgi:hypothetical protein